MLSWYAMLAKWSAFHVNISDARQRERGTGSEGEWEREWKMRASMWATRALNRIDYTEESLISE